MAAWLFPPPSAGGAGGEREGEESAPDAAAAAAAMYPTTLAPSPALRLRIFTHALCLYGKANLRNAAALFSLYAGLLTCEGGSGLERATTLLASMATVWAGAPYVLT